MEYNIFIEINGVQSFFANCENWTHSEGENLMRLINGIEYTGIPVEDGSAGLFNCTCIKVANILYSYINSDIQHA